MKTKVSSVHKEVVIGDDGPTVLIGERITGSFLIAAGAWLALARRG